MIVPRVTCDVECMVRDLAQNRAQREAGRAVLADGGTEAAALSAMCKTQPAAEDTPVCRAPVGPVRVWLTASEFTDNRMDKTSIPGNGVLVDGRFAVCAKCTEWARGKGWIS